MYCMLCYAHLTLAHCVALTRKPYSNEADGCFKLLAHMYGYAVRINQNTARPDM
jgi:hypothetical protein